MSPRWYLHRDRGGQTMPRAPKKCAHPSCEARVVGKTYCPDHQPTAWATSTRTGFTRATRRMRDLVLARDPICRCSGCRRCSMNGCARPSTDDDHIVNVASGGVDDIENHQGLCHPCHLVKVQHEAATARRAKYANR
ncbi:HNH endonuclease signature motif containing protein [Frondihabitans sp. 762G35]|uniref:HNH endonuclease signature motif containing protein n=1 Tax=Frondihabitans sp. 762G35 TaxID=1446794 RepID=UPI000E70673C